MRENKGGGGVGGRDGEDVRVKVNNGAQPMQCNTIYIFTLSLCKI